MTLPIAMSVVLLILGLPWREDVRLGPAGRVGVSVLGLAGLLSALGVF